MMLAMLANLVLAMVVVLEVSFMFCFSLLRGKVNLQTHVFFTLCSPSLSSSLFFPLRILKLLQSSFLCDGPSTQPTAKRIRTGAVFID
jgi:hypothetical protein